MAGSVSTLVVAGPAGRVALRVPASVTVADLLTEALAAVGGELDTTTSWLLARPKGEGLDPERTLGDLGLPDGSLLVLRPAVASEDETLSEDLPEAVASVVGSTPGQWSTEDVATLCAAAGVAAVLGLAYALAGMTPSIQQAGICFGVGLGIVVLAALCSRAPGVGRVGRWIALASLPLWALGGAGSAASISNGALAAAAVGLLVGAMAVWVAVDGARAQASGVALAAAIAGLGAAVAVPTKVAPDVAAGVAALLALAVMGLLPGMAVQMAGTLEIDPAQAGAKGQLEQSVAAGRDLLAWLLFGDAVLLGGSAVLLAAAAAPFGLALAGVIGLAAALQARHRGFLAEAGPLAVAAVVAAGALEAALAGKYVPGAWLPIAGSAIALVDVIVAVSIAYAAGRFASTVDSRRWFGLLEFVADAAVIPLILGLVGVYDFIFNQAKHLL